VGIESWEVFLPPHDIAREILKNEMVRRKNLFLKALEENDVSMLPRLIDDAKRSKCPYCPFYENVSIRILKLIRLEKWLRR
jgi:hypothetical protein